MSSQLKVKVSRSQPIRSVRKAPVCGSPHSQGPQTAARNSRPPSLRTHTLAHNSQLPGPTSNMATKTNRKSASVKTASIPPALPPENSSAAKKIKKNKEKKGEHQSSNSGTPDGRPNSSSKPTLTSNLTHESLSVDTMPALAPEHLNDSRKSQPAIAQNAQNQGQSQHPSDKVSSSLSLPTDGDPAGNTGSSLPQSQPSDPWHPAYTELRTLAAELRTMSKIMAQLDYIEKDVGDLKSKVDSFSNKAKELNNVIQSHSTDITSTKTDISSVQSDVEKHEEVIEQLLLK